MAITPLCHAESLATLSVPVPLRPGHPKAGSRYQLHGDLAPRGVRRGAVPIMDARGHLVAGLYGLDDAGCEWVEQALAQTQALDAFAHLRTSSI